jgi:hypothetical protein
MELVGIALSVPVAFVASLIYSILIMTVVRRFDLLRRALWWGSGAVLGWLAVEVVLLTVIGAVRARTLLGPGFYALHLIIFFLGTPALANILLLRRRPLSRWYWVVPICTLFAFVLVLLQIGVSEALYGIDGVDGPFSGVKRAIDVQSYKM